MTKARKGNFQESWKGTALFPRGPKNSITDVAGVKASHLTIQKDFEDGPGRPASVRTGLTAVLPYAMEKEMRLFAGCFVLNERGELTGYEVLDDFCYLNSPIVITNGFNVGVVYNAIFSSGLALKRVEIWPPVVIGIDDSYLSDMTSYVFSEEEVLRALGIASDPPLEEGSVGIGLGLRALGWKGGIGSSSRLLSLAGKQFALGALIASNHGNGGSEKERGSLTIIIGVDVPVLPHQIKRIAQGLASSIPSVLRPDFEDTVTCLMFSTANPMSMEQLLNAEHYGPPAFDYQMIDDSFLGQIMAAGREAVAEAILNSLIKAARVQGKCGRIVRTIPDSEWTKLKPQVS